MNDKILIEALYKEIKELHKKVLDLENKNSELSKNIEVLTEYLKNDKIGLYEK